MPADICCQSRISLCRAFGDGDSLEPDRMPMNSLPAKSLTFANGLRATTYRTVYDKDGNEIDMRQNFDDEETGFDMRDVAGSETVTNENELLNDYTIKDADAGFDDPSVLEDDNSGSAAPASDEVDF